MIEIMKKVIGLSIIGYASGVLVGCGQNNNFTLKSEPVEAKTKPAYSYDKSRSAIYYRLPTSEFTLSAKFEVWEKQVVSFDLHTEKVTVLAKEYEFVPSRKEGGFTITPKKVGHENQAFIIDLNRSESPYTAVNDLTVNVSSEGYITSITSDLSDKKKEAFDNTIDAIGNVVSVVNGGLSSLAKANIMGRSTHERHVRRENLDFTVKKTFRLDDGSLKKNEASDDKGKSFSKFEHYLDLTVILKEIHPRVDKSKESRAENLRFYIRGNKKAFESLDAEKIVTKIRPTIPQNENPYVTGVVYPLPTRIQGELVYGGKTYSTIRFKSIQGGGFDRLQVSSKSFADRTYKYTFGADTGIPTKVELTSTSQAEGATAALSAATGKVDEVLNTIRQNQAARIAAEETKITAIATAEKNMIQQQHKVDDLKEQIENEKDEAKKKELERKLQLEEISLREKQDLLNAAKKKPVTPAPQ